MESKFIYQLTQTANVDLDEIVSYIAVELANLQAASDFVDKLQDAIEEARSFPQSGLPVGNEFLADKEVRKKLVGNYIMYYMPDYAKKTVFILRIIFGRRNMDEILRRMDLTDQGMV